MPLCRVSQAADSLSGSNHMLLACYVCVRPRHQQPPGLIPLLPSSSRTGDELPRPTRKLPAPSLSLGSHLSLLVLSLSRVMTGQP